MKNSKMILMVSTLMALMSVSAFAESQKAAPTTPSNGVTSSSVGCPGPTSANEKNLPSDAVDKVDADTTKAGTGK